MIQLPVVVYVLEDDSSARRALCRLLSCSGFEARSFATVQELLGECDQMPDSGCVVADVRLVEGDSLALPILLRERGRQLPVIFITAIDDEQGRNQARRAGAAAYFRKPVDHKALLDAIAWALGTVSPDARSDEGGSIGA